MARLKAGIHFASSIFVKTIAGLIIIKVLAWKLGPDGFGLLGQLMTLVAITGMFAGGGIASGLIKVLAVSPSGTKEGQAWIATAFTLTTIVSGLVASLLVLFSGALSARLMQGEFTAVFIFLGFSQIVVGYGSLVQADASSRGESGIYAAINILGTIIGAIVLVLGVCVFGFGGAAYGVMLMPALTGLVALGFLFQRRRELLRYARLLLDESKARHFMSFSLLTLVGALSVPIAQIIIRDMLAQRVGWEQVGLWQGMIKLSDVYMQFIGVVLINYVLPRYAAASSFDRVLMEFKATVIWLLLALVAGFLCLYSLRNIVIQLIFSKDFLPMTEYFIPQMIGDVFRTIAAAISFIFMARGCVRISILYEIAQGVGIIVMFMLLFDGAGKMAPVYAHMITYIVLSVIMAVGLKLWMRRQS